MYSEWVQSCDVEQWLFFFYPWQAKKHHDKNSAESPNSVSNYTRQQDFVTWKVYCVCNVSFHAEFKYAIRIFLSPTVFVQWHFLLSIFRNFRYLLQLFFLYVNQYFEWFWTEGGHRQFTIIKSLAACAQKH